MHEMRMSICRVQAKKRLSPILQRLPKAVRTSEGPHVFEDSDHHLSAADLPHSTRTVLARLRRAGAPGHMSAAHSLLNLSLHFRVHAAYRS